jgi:NCS1 family nucleobase:cation symporter-1
MFLGHYLAWICAGIMGAAAGLMVIEGVGNDAGGVAYKALGTTGIITVIIAGWTTSNPTLYRAGLAFQAVTPGWPRWLVTLAAGAVTTVIACSPFVFTELLNFVGIYGLLLMPVGSIVFVEHWIFPKIGLTQFWVSKKKLLVSWPALASWAIAMAAALVLERTGTIHLFFLFVPVWVLTAVLYIIFASLAGAREKFADEKQEQPAEQITGEAADRESKVRMPKWTEAPKQADVVLWICGAVALASLAACIILPIWVYTTSGEDYERNFAWFKRILIWPTLIYFIAGTIWAVKRDKAE